MRNWLTSYAAILAAMCLPLDAYGAPAFLPDCAGKIEIAKAQVERKNLYRPYTFLESRAGMGARLYRYARALVRASAERSMDASPSGA